MGVPKLQECEAVEYSVLHPLDCEADAPPRSAWLFRPDATPRPVPHEVTIGLSAAQRALEHVRRGVGKTVVRMATLREIQARVVQRQDHAIEKDLVDLPRELEVASSFPAAVDIAPQAPQAAQTGEELSACGDKGSSALVALATVKRGLVVSAEAFDAPLSLSRAANPLLMPLSDERIRHFTMEQARDFAAADAGESEDAVMQGAAAAAAGASGNKRGFTGDAATALPAKFAVAGSAGSAGSVGSSSSSSSSCSGSVGSDDSASKRSKASNSSASAAAAASAAGAGGAGAQPRRRTKIPPSAVQDLESWFAAHLQKPYPSEDEKRELTQRTGLDLVQLHNWFTNTRKRRWVQDPSDPARNQLTAIRIDKGGAGDAPMKPKVKRGPRNAAASAEVAKANKKKKQGGAESDEEEHEVDGSSASDVVEA